MWRTLGSGNRCLAHVGRGLVLNVCNGAGRFGRLGIGRRANFGPGILGLATVVAATILTPLPHPPASRDSRVT